ncbi:MAG: alpha-E domain-containing protein [Alphaproteobacteria bacterium]
MMLTRVADGLYWIGRYVERAEHTARLADVMLNASLDYSDSAAETATIALKAIGDPKVAAARGTPFEAAMDLAFDRDGFASIVTSLAQARENARQMRDQITTEMWEQLNALYLDITGPGSRLAFDQGSSTFLHRIVAGLHLFKGASEATMSHGEGWRYLSLGAYLERAQLIARLLDAAFGKPSVGDTERDHLVQVSLLRMACALEPYLRAHTSDIRPALILEFLLFNKEFPRSIRFTTARIEEHARALSQHAETVGAAAPERLAGRLSALLEFTDASDLATNGASEILRTVTLECGRIHEAIHDTFVAYPIERRLPA